MGRKYSITIQAHGEPSMEASPKIMAVVQVDADGTTQLVEMTVGTADGGPIPPSAARNIDFSMLADAIGGVVSAAFAPPVNGAAAEPKTARPARPDAEPVEPAQHRERPYRRMPDASEVAEVIQKTGSVGKLAQHFDVPRYTAQAWVNRLRKTGQLDDNLHSPRASA
jgi:hypothetical protein